MESLAEKYQLFAELYNFLSFFHSISTLTCCNGTKLLNLADDPQQKLLISLQEGMIYEHRK